MGQWRPPFGDGHHQVRRRKGRPAELVEPGQRQTATYKKAYTTALGKSWFAWATDYVDLGDLCKKLNAQSTIADPALRAANDKVVADLTGARIAQSTRRGSASATGLTMWWPSASTWSTNQAAYQAQVSFAQAAPAGANWWSFLDAYNR